MPGRPRIGGPGFVQETDGEAVAMFLKVFSSAVVLPLGGRHHSFRSPRELEAALGDWTRPSSSRAAALAELPDDALLRESDRFGHLERRLAQALEARAALGELLRELDVAQATADTSWRVLMDALEALDSRYDAYKRAALGRYLQYLATGRELIMSIYSSRQNRPAASLPAGDAGPQGAATLMPRQRLIHDPREIFGAEGAEQIHRLPKGEAVQLVMHPHQSAALMLSKHRFLLVSGDPYLLVDEDGNDARLKPGRNVIGRSESADVPLDRGFRAISRKHLIVELCDGGVVKLTDISTLGTFAPVEAPEGLLH